VDPAPIAAQTAIRRLQAILPRLAHHDHRLASNLQPHVEELDKIRFDYLGQIDQVLSQYQRPDIRLDTLLGYHRVVLMWLTDLAGRDLQPTELPESDDRAVLDIVTVLLLWNLTRGFYATQRLVQVCLLALADDHLASG
jgi:hypothetical protein